MNRILAAQDMAASFANILALADALGMDILTRQQMDSEKFRQQHAERKAKKLVGLVQGTSALEAQAVSEKTIERFVRQTTRQLLASKPKLWDE